MASTVKVAPGTGGRAALIESGSVLIVPPSTFQSGVASRLEISTIGPALT